MFDSTIEMAEQGITVPYPPIFDSIRVNQGFVDTRGRPELASKISEGAQSLAIRDLLVKLAQSDSKVFSVGCDVGTKFVTEDESPYYEAGGYVQIMSKNYAQRSPQEYERYGEAVAKLLQDRSRGHEWLLNLVIMPVEFNLDEFRDMTGSLWIWFRAFGDTEDYAVASRETCIAELGKCLLDEISLTCFE